MGFFIFKEHVTRYAVVEVEQDQATVDEMSPAELEDLFLELAIQQVDDEGWNSEEVTEQFFLHNHGDTEES